MSIFSPGFLGIVASITALTSAMERGDVDEAARQGALAGPAALEQALTNPSRATVLGAIAAAPSTEGRTDLLPALASLASSGDRRVAIPAALSARTIARELARSARDGRAPDDLDPDDVASWRGLFSALAANQARFIEVRTLALDTLVELADVSHDAIGFDVSAALADPDPAYRAVALDLIPRPTPPGIYDALAKVVLGEPDDDLARKAAGVLCGDAPAAVRPLLGHAGLERIEALVAKRPAKTTRDARRCLAR